MLSVNLISWDNGVGLSRDLVLLGEALAGAGAAVTYTRRGRGKLRKLARPLKVRGQTTWQALRRLEPRFDLNIVLEHVWPDYLPLARRTAFVPNPEWCRPADLAALDKVSLVLAKTREAERIFRGIDCPTTFIGFTSPDRLDRAVPRERAFFHLAGRSRNKGTDALLELWRKRPDWPTLTVVQNPLNAKATPPAGNVHHIVGYLSDAELKRLQNAHRFHLCPSETEGFGHYLAEAMSVAAVTLTLDAPPMNELVRPQRGVLVAAARTGVQNLATTYFPDPSAMAEAIDGLLAMNDAQADAYGAAARAWFERNAAAFPRRLVEAIASSFLPDPASP